MKIRPFFLYLAASLLISVSVLAAESPKLETLLGEYQKARTDVLSKLNESYAVQADALAKHYQALPNLDGADRARTFAKNLRDPDQKNDLHAVTDGKNAADPLVVLQANYAEARDANLTNVCTFYTTTAANLRQQLLKSNDQAGAEVLSTFIEKIKPAGLTVPATASPAKKKKAPAK